MKVYLRYQADLWVTVDLDEEEVDDVVVDAASLVEPAEAVGSVGPLDARAISEAVRIADSATWPTWDVRG